MSLISPSPWRKGWQEFKQRNPSFEKARGYKANLGPALDQLVKLHGQTYDAEVAMVAGRKKLDALAASYESACRMADAAMKEYEKVVHDLKNPKMLADWNSFRAHNRAILETGMNAKKVLSEGQY